MLSLFPSLLSWSELSPLIIRLTLAAVFLYSSYSVLQAKKKTQNEKAAAAIEGLASLFLVIGLWTQAAALILILDLVIRLIDKFNKKALLTQGVNYYLLLLVMAISLLLTNPGLFSIDFPL